MAVSAKVVVGCTGFCAVFISGLIMFICSFSSLGATEVGLDYSAFSKSVDSTVYQSGLHFLGLGHSFIKFPTTLQSVDFTNADPVNGPLFTRTSDGLPLTLEISFQFRYNPDVIYKLFQTYNGDHLQVFTNTADHLINIVATVYPAYNFTKNKEAIAAYMQTVLNDAFIADFGCSVEALQITSTVLPTSFEDAIQDTISIQQNVTQVQQQMGNVQVQLMTAIIVAEQNRLATINLAQGQASQILQAAGAAANATLHTLQAEAQSYRMIQQQLGLSNNQTLEYIWWDALADPASSSSSSQFLVNVNPSAYIRT